MDKEMMDRLIAIQMKHNPQTRVGAAIVVTELLTAMREPTQKMLDAVANYGWTEGKSDVEGIWSDMIDAIIGDK
jgi:hypothetical protein